MYCTCTCIVRMLHTRVCVYIYIHCTRQIEHHRADSLGLSGTPYFNDTFPLLPWVLFRITTLLMRDNMQKF